LTLEVLIAVIMSLRLQQWSMVSSREHQLKVEGLTRLTSSLR